MSAALLRGETERLSILLVEYNAAIYSCMANAAIYSCTQMAKPIFLNLSNGLPTYN
jgi:hypothetical protein